MAALVAAAGCMAGLAGAAVAAPGAAAASAPAEAVASATEDPQRARPRLVTFAADVYFDRNKSELEPAARRKLDVLVQHLRALDVEAITVVGHTDGDASVAFNQRLSEARSDAVRRYLVAKGIRPGIIHLGGRGKGQPVADNATRTGKARNRRVEIEVVAQQQPAP